MSFAEITDDDEVDEADATPDETAVDVSGVPDVLHELMRAYAVADPDGFDREREAARRVFVNADGSVAVEFVTPVKFKGAEHAGVRLRALRSRDYFDGLTAQLADTANFAETLRFATYLVPKSMIGILEDVSFDDMKAVFLGAVALRKNFSRPKS